MGMVPLGDWRGRSRSNMLLRGGTGDVSSPCVCIELWNVINFAYQTSEDRESM